MTTTVLEWRNAQIAERYVQAVRRGLSHADACAEIGEHPVSAVVEAAPRTDAKPDPRKPRTDRLG